MSARVESRADRLRARLLLLQHVGVVTDWYSYAPGDVGRRWSVWGAGWDRTFGTAELELFVMGAERAIATERKAQRVASV